MVAAPPDGFASPRPKLSFFVPDRGRAQMWFEGECFRLFLNRLPQSDKHAMPNCYFKLKTILTDVNFGFRWSQLDPTPIFVCCTDVFLVFV